MKPDITPYLYVTENLGKSWRSIAKGLPAAPVNVVREDPIDASIVYAGTDRGAYVSRDRGAHWQVLGADLHPNNTTPVRAPQPSGPLSAGRITSPGRSTCLP